MGNACQECGESNLEEFEDPNLKNVCVFCTDEDENGANDED